MTTIPLDDVTAALQIARVTPSGVTFAGKSLKLDDAASAQVIVDAIANSKSLECLNLEGNTLGVEAAEAIAKALEKHPEFKRALWKDMFTGRLKTEIPQALKHLGDGLVTAGARLTELDLSDNAFGPIGVQGLAELLRSSTCFALEELRLNNNGLGITGGKLLASALLDCYNSSRQQEHTFALKVFIAGRNRLENEGAKALAQVFKTLGSLEEISMPQNGIYHVGVSALSEAFSMNKNLQILNLNDNTIGWKGATALANAFIKLEKLRVINFGDSLLKTKGAIALAEGLKNNAQLEELILGFNEIHKKGGIALANCIGNKQKLKSLVLDGNMFNKATRQEIKEIIKKNGRYNANTPSLEECDSDEEEENEDSEHNASTEEEDDSEKEEDTLETINNSINESKTCVSFEDFIKNPTANNFMDMGNDRDQIILNRVKQDSDTYLENLIPIIMKTSALCIDDQEAIVKSAEHCSSVLYKELFMWANSKDNLSLVNNALLVNLGLIKSEDKNFKPTWKLEGCFLVLEKIILENYVPEPTKDTIKVFMGRDFQNDSEDLRQQRKKILQILSK